MPALLRMIFRKVRSTNRSSTVQRLVNWEYFRHLSAACRKHKKRMKLQAAAKRARSRPCITGGGMSAAEQPPRKRPLCNQGGRFSIGFVYQADELLLNRGQLRLGVVSCVLYFSGSTEVIHKLTMGKRVDLGLRGLFGNGENELTSIFYCRLVTMATNLVEIASASCIYIMNH